MRIYNNAEEISHDLEILKLRRDISIEELKLVKQDFKDEFSVSNWVQVTLKALAKLGVYKMVKKVF